MDDRVVARRTPKGAGNAIEVTTTDERGGGTTIAKLKVAVRYGR